MFSILEKCIIIYIIGVGETLTQNLYIYINRREEAKMALPNNILYFPEYTIIYTLVYFLYFDITYNIPLFT